jgi:hypothetical protein
MINSSRKLAGTLVAFCFTCANAGEALVFNDPGLTGYKEGSTIAGVYSSVSTRFSCFFIFFQTRPTSNTTNEYGFSDTEIFTFVPGNDSLTFEDRNKRFDISGNLYRRDEKGQSKRRKGKLAAKTPPEHSLSI